MKWVLAECDETVVSGLAGSGFHPLMARLLAIRGLPDAAGAGAFLSCDLSGLSQPGIFLDIDRAVSRVRLALSGKEKITVYGDYDVDGVTGASLLYLALKQLGADVAYYIPDRITEGYGLNSKALDSIKAGGSGLVISADCGITAFSEADHARAIGLDLIVTDHHEINRSSSDDRDNGKPGAFAVLHPSFLVSGTPEQQRESVAGLTGVGVAFKLAQALLDLPADDERVKSYLDLVTLGTVADVGRIIGENRVLVRHGLELLSAEEGTGRPGIAALKEVSRSNGKRITTGMVGFTLAPRINASGRLERADAAFHLLTTGSREEAQQLAEELDRVNKERQEVEEEILADALKLCGKMDTAAAGALVLHSGTWHPGVIGIVASRIVERFYRPAALISVEKGVGKGSARSIPGFDLYAGLAACADLLLGFGGHKYAAGFSIDEKNIPKLAERLSGIVRERVGPDGFIRSLTIDGKVELRDLDLDLVRQIEQLAPFGPGNPEPKLGARGLTVASARTVGNNHLKLRLKQGNGTSIDAIAFNRGEMLNGQVREGATVAVVFTPRISTWNERNSVELEIRDIKIEKESSKSHIPDKFQ